MREGVASEALGVNESSCRRLLFCGGDKTDGIVRYDRKINR